MSAEGVKSEEEWRRQLTPEQYEVLRGKGTEPPFSGKYVYWKEDGTYHCGACGAELFSSKAKFDSGTGWPSFFEALDTSRVEVRPDRSHFMERVEVLCRRCGSHLGHVFEDGPPPTGQRYCINSVSLAFERSESSEFAGGSARDEAAVNDKRGSGHKGRSV